MLRNKLVRSDGSIIDSSVIISCEFTEEVNSTTNLSVGCVTASELTVEILATDIIRQDEVLTYYTVEDGVETKIGVFNAEKPTVATRTSMRFTAYDNVAKTEKNFSDWLRANQSLFPMTLLTLVETACTHCGVTLATTSFPHADLAVNAFYADGLTCRQILSWAAAIAGRFIRANVDGALEFAWYVDSINISVQPNKSASFIGEANLVEDGEGNVSIESDDIVLMDDGDGNIVIKSQRIAITDDGMGNVVLSARTGLAIPFRQGSLSYENYTTDRINRVQIKHSDDDVGVIYPAEADGNCFTISENMILGVISRGDVTSIATSLHEQLGGITYVPFSVTVPRTIRIRAGDTVTVTDLKGHTFTSYVMKVAMTPGGTTLSATGDKSYGSNVAVSSEKYSNLTGKILSISRSVDGLLIKAEDLAGNIATLTLSTEEFRTYVQNNFVSEGEFGDYKTTISSEFEQTALGFSQNFEYVKTEMGEIRGELEDLGENVGVIDQSLIDVKAHINPGILYYDENGAPVYGIEIGQRTEIDGVETFNKYARFTANKLAFYDQHGTEVSYISDMKQHITHAEVTGSLQLGGFVDTVQADGSIVTKWVGGGS